MLGSLVLLKTSRTGIWTGDLETPQILVAIILIWFNTHYLEENMQEENRPMLTAWRPLAGCIRRPRAVFQICKVTQYPKRIILCREEGLVRYKVVKIHNGD
jgi:hypothetical protein